MSISNQEQALDPLRGTRWLCDTIRAHMTNRQMPVSRLAPVQLLALITFALILVASIQSADSASLTAVGKHKSSRDRGCYYMLQHYRNGEQIKTDEPCLNCTCENSMLMCYLRVCPYVKPVGDKCIIERVPGECCPRITCADVAPPADSFEQDTIEPETSSPAPSVAGDVTASTSSSNGSESKQSAQESNTLTASSLFDVTFTNGTTSSANSAEFAAKSGGCMLSGQFYPEGAQMPADPSKSCEVCYCIRSSAACVMQDCALEVSGCAPIYSPGGCCPTRYNCSAENAFTTPRPKTLIGADTSQKRRKFWDLSPSRFTNLASEGITSLMGLSSTASPSGSLQPIAVPDFGRRGPASSSTGAGCRAPNSTRIFADGERVPSKNKCEHCYCMRGELVCAVQECRPPCDGCVPIIDAQDQCCPKRYECAAPTQRVSTDNLIIESQDSASNATGSQQAAEPNANVTSSPSLFSTIESFFKDVAATVSTSTLPPPLDASTTTAESAEAIESNNNKQENSVMTTRQTKPPLRPISPKLSTTADEDIASEAAPKDDAPVKQAKPSDGRQVSNVDGFNLNGGEREQEASEVGKSAGRVEAPEGSVGANSQDSNEIPHSASSTSSTLAPPEMVSDEPAASVPQSQPEKTIIVTNMPASPPMDGMNLVSSDRKPRPLVVPSQIPGEGSCRYKGRVYQNGDEIKSDQLCAGLCMCINSVVYCDEIDCPNPPENTDKCQMIKEPGVCCPKYICPEEASTTTTTTTTTTSTVSPPAEPKTDTNVASEQPQDLSTSSTPGTEIVSSEQPAEVTSSVPSTTSEPIVSSSTEIPTSSAPVEMPKSTEASSEERKESSSTESSTTSPAVSSSQPEATTTAGSLKELSSADETSPVPTKEVDGRVDVPAVTEASTTTSATSTEKSSEDPVGFSTNSGEAITTNASPPASLNEVAISSNSPSQETSSESTPKQTGEQSTSAEDTSRKEEIATTPSPGIISTIINFVTSTTSAAPQTESTTPSANIEDQPAPSTSEQPTKDEAYSKQAEEQATTPKLEIANKDQESPQTNFVESVREELASSTTSQPITKSSSGLDLSSTTRETTSPQTEAAPVPTSAQPDISNGVSNSPSEPTTTTAAPPAQTETSSPAGQESVIQSTSAPEATSSSSASTPPADSTSTQTPETSAPLDSSNKSAENPDISVKESPPVATESTTGEPVAASTVSPIQPESSSTSLNERVSTHSNQESSTPSLEIETSSSSIPSESSSQPPSDRPSESPAVNLIETSGSSNAPLDLDRLSSTPAPTATQTEGINETSSTVSSTSAAPESEESSSFTSAKSGPSLIETTPATPPAIPESRADGSNISEDASKPSQTDSSSPPDSSTTTTALPVISEQTVSSSSSPNQETPTTVSTFDVASSSTTQSPSTGEQKHSETTTSAMLPSEPPTLAPEPKKSDQQPIESSTSVNPAAPMSPGSSAIATSSTEKVLDSSPTSEVPLSSTNVAEITSESSTTPQGAETSTAPILTESRAEEPKMSGPAESFSSEPSIEPGTSTNAASTTPEVTQPPSSESSQDVSLAPSPSPTVFTSELSKSDQDPARNVVANSSDGSSTSAPISIDNKQEAGSTEAPGTNTTVDQADMKSQTTSIVESTSSPVTTESSPTVGGANLTAGEPANDTATRTNEQSSEGPPQVSTDSPLTSEKGILTTVMDFVTGASSSPVVDVTPSPTVKASELSTETSNAPAESEQGAASSTLAPYSNAPESTSAPAEVVSSISVTSAAVNPDERSEASSSIAPQQPPTTTVAPSSSINDAAPASDSPAGSTVAPQSTSESSAENEVSVKTDATTDTSSTPTSEVSTSGPETTSSSTEILSTTSGSTELPSSSETARIEVTPASELSSTNSPSQGVASETKPADNVIETSAKSDVDQMTPLTESTTSTAPVLESQASSTSEPQATSSAPAEATSQLPAISESPNNSAKVETKSEPPAPVESSSSSSDAPVEPTTERSSVSSSDSSTTESSASSSSPPPVNEPATGPATTEASSFFAPVDPAVLTESRVEEPKMVDVAKSFSMDPATTTNLTTSPESNPTSTTLQSAETTTNSATLAPTAFEASGNTSAAVSLDLQPSPQPAESNETATTSSRTPEVVHEPKIAAADENLIDTSATSTTSPPIEATSSISSDQSSPSIIDSTTPAPISDSTTSQSPELPSATSLDPSATSGSPQPSSTSTNAPEPPSSSSVPPAAESRSDASDTNVIEGISEAAKPSTMEPEKASTEQELASTSTVAPTSPPESSSTSAEVAKKEEIPEAPAATKTRAEEPRSSEAPLSSTTEAALVTEQPTTTASPDSSTTSQSSLEMDSSSSSELPASPSNATFAGEPSTAAPAQPASEAATSTAASQSAPNNNENTFEARRPSSTPASDEQTSPPSSSVPMSESTASPPAPDSSSTSAPSSGETTSASSVPSNAEGLSPNGSSTNEVDPANSSSGLFSTVMSYITTTTSAPRTPDASTTTTSKPIDLESFPSTAAPAVDTNVTTTSPADEFVTGVSTIKSAEFAPVNVTTTIPSIRGVASSVTIPWSDISNSSTSSSPTTQASNAQPEVKSEPAANGTLSIDSLTPSSSPAPASSTDSDYEEVTDEPGCEYEGKSYSSAQQIARAHPCDFCFCFRGDIICLQQTCPPPVPHCFETVIDGFCCPRYECPVHTVRSSPNSSGLTLTPYETHSRLHAHVHDPPGSNSTKPSNVRGCFVDNKLIPVGKVIESASGPCLECLCDRSGMMKCNPKECTPEDPLLQQINREVLQSGVSRSQRRRR